VDDLHVDDLLPDGWKKASRLDDSNCCGFHDHWTFFPKRHVQMTTQHLNRFGVVQGLMQINHWLGHASHASVGRQNLRSTTERPLPYVRKM